ncbi:MAG: MATE family efflux transporter [Chitinophagaceae bacterium]|nr:MATE family efflux transporter [Chitinophagaceae bacterium]
MSATTSSDSLQVSITNRQILKIALPISFALLVPQINFITNNIFLGQLGEQELAAAGLTGVYYLIFAAIGFGLNNGLQALISRRAGENRVDEIGKLFSQGVRISLVIAASGILITYFLAPVILRNAIDSSETYHQCIEFLRIRIWGLPFLYIYQMRNALLVGTNQSKYLVAGTAAETIANIFFDYTLINGHWGFPNLGFNGAAFASIIAEAIGMFVVFLVIHMKGISKRFSLYGKFGYDRINTRLILVQSSPLIAQHAISLISWIFFYILIEHHGQRDLAISNTMRNIFGFFGVFTWAFAATTNTMVSNVIGQGKKEQVITLINKIMRISMALSLGVAIILNLFPHLFLSIYSQGESFVEDAIPVVRIVSSALILMSFSTVWLNAVTGTGNSKITLYIEAITIVLYCIYVYLVLEVFKLPITIGWMSEWLYWTVLFTASYLYIRSGKWKGKVI